MSARFPRDCPTIARTRSARMIRSCISRFLQDRRFVAARLWLRVTYRSGFSSARCKQSRICTFPQECRTNPARFPHDFPHDFAHDFAHKLMLPAGFPARCALACGALRAVPCALCGDFPPLQCPLMCPFLCPLLLGRLCKCCGRGRKRASCCARPRHLRRISSAAASPMPRSAPCPLSVRSLSAPCPR